MPQVGSAWIQVTPSLKGFNQRVRQELRRELAGLKIEIPVEVDLEGVKREASRKGQEAGGEFAQSFRRRVEAALKSLPDVKIDADSTDAQREIAGIREELRTLGDRTVGIDLDAGEATAKIQQLQQRLNRLAAEDSTVDLDVDIAAASAHLAQIDQQVDRLDGRRVSVEVDVDRGGTALGSMSRLERQAAGLASVGFLLGPAFSSGFAAATFGALGFASAAASASAGVGALVAASLPALMNVADAVKATEQAEKATATSAITTTRQRVGAAYQAQQAAQRVAEAQQQVNRTSVEGARRVSDAQRAADRTAVEGARRVQDAQRALGDARREVAERIENANERVADSERQLERSHEAVQRAQEDLTRAREDALRTLQDLREETSDLALSEEGAEIALIRARQRQAEVNRDASSTLLDRREAALEVAEAEDRLSDVQRDQRRTRQELTAAERAGISGSEQVLSANDRLADAQQSLADAQRDRSEAQRDLARAEADGARTIADAERSLSDARIQAAQANADAERSLSDARTQAAEANADASRAVADALAAQAQQAELANLQAENGITANRNLAYQLGLLTPLQRELYDGWFRLRDAFTAWAQSLEPAVIPLFLDGMRLIEDLLPRLTPIVLGAAGAFDALLDKASRALQSPFWQEFFDFLGRTGGPILYGFGIIIGNVATGFAGILMAFEPMAAKLTLGLVYLSGRFKEWATSLDAKTIEDMWDRISDRVGGFVDDMVRLWDEGLLPLLKSPEMKEFLQAWQDFHSRVWEKLIDNLVIFLNDVAPPLLEFLSRILEVMLELDDATGGAVSSLAGFIAVASLLSALPGGSLVVSGLTAALGGLAAVLGIPAGVAGVGLIGGLVSLYLWTQFVIDKWGEWASAIPLFTGPIGIAAFILGGLIENFDLLKETLSDLLDWVRDNWQFLPLLFTGPLGIAFLLIIAHWDKIKGAFLAAWHWIRDEVLKKFGAYWHDHIYPKLDAARDFVVRNWDRIKGAFLAAWHWIRDEVLKKLALYWEQRVYPKFRDARDFFRRIWKQISDIAAGAWDRITDVIRGGVNLAIKIINKVISAINRIANGLGIDVEIRTITPLKDPDRHAMGTYDLAKDGSFITGGARAIVGEGRQQYPEAVIATDPQFRPRNVGILGWTADQLGYDLVPRMARGGIARAKGPGIAGLYPPLASAVAKVVREGGGGVSISSGWRDSAQQAVLYHRFQSGQGPVAARPGSSQHEAGNAVDFGGNVSLYTRLAQKAGLIRTVPSEKWHWEFPGQGRGGGGGGGIFSSVADVVGAIVDAARGIGDIDLKLIRGAAGWVKDQAIKWAKRVAFEVLEPVVGSAGGIGRAYLEAGSGGNVERWRDDALRALRATGSPTSWIGSLLRRMQQESGGNPNIVNLWDDNARRGTPSVGLMQVIGPTYRSNAPRNDRGPFKYGTSVDPFENIYASIRYTVGRYGSGPAGWDRPGGYAMGGILPFLGSYQTGTMRVPHDGLAFLHRDEAVLDHSDAAMFRQAGMDSVKSRTFQQTNQFYGITDYGEIARTTGDELAWQVTVGSH